MTGDQIDVLPADRAVDARAAVDKYERLIVDSQHPPGIEAAIAVACARHIARNGAYVHYLRSSDRARPGRQGRSRAWGEADATRFGAIEVVAAVLGAEYPSPTGHPPISETEALIEKRVGPLCVGWDDHGALRHHMNDNCPVHPTTKGE